MTVNIYNQDSGSLCAFIQDKKQMDLILGKNMPPNNLAIIRDSRSYGGCLLYKDPLGEYALIGCDSKEIKSEFFDNIFVEVIHENNKLIIYKQKEKLGHL